MVLGGKQKYLFIVKFSTKFDLISNGSVTNFWQIRVAPIHLYDFLHIAKCFFAFTLFHNILFFKETFWPKSHLKLERTNNCLWICQIPSLFTSGSVVKWQHERLRILRSEVQTPWPVSFFSSSKVNDFLVHYDDKNGLRSQIKMSLLNQKKIQPTIPFVQPVSQRLCPTDFAQC